MTDLAAALIALGGLLDLLGAGLTMQGIKADRSQSDALVVRPVDDVALTRALWREEDLRLGQAEANDDDLRTKLSTSLRAGLRGRKVAFWLLVVGTVMGTVGGTLALTNWIGR